MLLRLARPQDYVLVHLSPDQVKKQPAMAATPLTLEPTSDIYTDPVVVLDFQVGLVSKLLCLLSGAHTMWSVTVPLPFDHDRVQLVLLNMLRSSW